MAEGTFDTSIMDRNRIKMSRRIITSEETEEDVRIDENLRPHCLDQYIGQEKVKNTLKI